MSVVKATPYLFFNGTAAQALELYRHALGAEVSEVAHYRDMPADAGMCKPEHLDRIMNASIRIGDAELMCSDRTDPVEGEGNGDVQITLHFDDAEQMARSFEALSKGAHVFLPIHDAFWGDKFGALRDKFGIGWQFILPNAQA